MQRGSFNSLSANTRTVTQQNASHLYTVCLVSVIVTLQARLHSKSNPTMAQKICEVSSNGTRIVCKMANPTGPKFEKRGVQKALPKKGTHKFARVSCPLLSLGQPNFEFGSGAPMRATRVVCRVEERCVRCRS